MRALYNAHFCGNVKVLCNWNRKTVATGFAIPINYLKVVRQRMRKHYTYYMYI